MQKYGITAEQAGDGSPDLRWLFREKKGHARPYAPGDRPLDGVRAFPGRETNEVVLWLEDQRAVVAGDTLVDFGEGLEIPAVWLREGVMREQVVEGLRPLLELPVELVLPTHGGPADRPRRAPNERSRDATLLRYGSPTRLLRALPTHVAAPPTCLREPLGVQSRPGAVSSVGRAPARQAGGHWFEPSTAHSRNLAPGVGLRRGGIGAPSTFMAGEGFPECMKLTTSPSFLRTPSSSRRSPEMIATARTSAVTEVIEFLGRAPKSRSPHGRCLGRDGRRIARCAPSSILWHGSQRPRRDTSRQIPSRAGYTRSERASCRAGTRARRSTSRPSP